MGRKKGITVTMLTVTLIVLAILATTITVSIHSTVNYSRVTTWSNEMGYIQSVVDEELKLNSGVPTLDSISMDVSGLSEEVLNEQFKDETISGEDTITLQVLDLGKLKITNTIYGNLETDTDVYAYSTTTGRVYYVQGLTASGTTYFTLTEELRTRYELDGANNTLTSVVFKSNKIGFTNEAITLTVYVPENYTNVQITTTNNGIQIGERVLNNGRYEYSVNTNGVLGSYEVTATYTADGTTQTATYSVNTYDNTKPVINEINKETDTIITDNVMQIINLKATDENGVKYFKYAPKEINEEEAKEYFSSNGNNIVNGRLNLNANIYTLYAEDNAGNYVTNIIYTTDYIQPDWVTSYTTEGVPIPKGFVASMDEKEDEIEEGLVIYEGTKPVTSENVETAKKTRNQYVWIPVDKTAFDTTFVRKFNNDATSTNIVDTEGNYYALGTSSKYWEATPYLELTTANLTYMTKDTLEEVQKMYASVEKYGGFYVARYEAGVDESNVRGEGATGIVKTLTNVHSKMNKIPYNYIGFSNSAAMNVETGGAVEVARSLYPETNTNYGVVSTLMYGVQWDRTLSWWEETSAVTSLTDSTTYGNYSDNEIAYDTFNEGAKYTTTYGSATPTYYEVTAKSTEWLLTTGATEETRVNNIYDMAGNLEEWTIEGYSTAFRTYRGGFFTDDGDNYPVTYRNDNSPTIAGYCSGFRPTLYIKLPT